MANESPEIAADRLMTSIASRRNFLKGILATGAAAGAAGALKTSAFAQTTAADTPAQIFSIAATAERLAVTFYTNGIINAQNLGLSGANLDALKAFAIEEQIHELFFVANGGTPLTSTFSFPMGAATFTNLANFIATQQQLEGAFDSAFIAAAYEFALMGNAAVARIAVQIAMIEEGHRTVGRSIGGLDPAEEKAYVPQLVPNVGAAPGVLAAAGYLSPVAGNSYTYSQIDFTSPTYSSVFATVMNQTPFVATGGTPTLATPVYGHHADKAKHHTAKHHAAKHRAAKHRAAKHHAAKHH